MKTFVLYARVSSDEQRDAETIKNQITEIERYAASHNIALGEYYKDDGFTGMVPLHERPEGARLLADAQRGLFGGVICLNHKRIGRTAFVIHQAVELLEGEGVEILAVREPLPSEMNAGARSLMRAVYAGVAQHDREDFLANSREGMQRAAREGRWCGGRPPFGYRLERMGPSLKQSRLVVHDEQAATVREIYSLYINGTRIRGIVRHLNALGVPHPMGWYNPAKARPWYDATVCNILKDRRFLGEWAWGKTTSKKGKEPVKITHTIPAIVTVDEFDEVQKIITANRQFSPRNLKRHYLLRGLIKCGFCGLGYTGLMGGNFRYYRCVSHVNSNYRTPCGNKPLRADRIEAEIWQRCLAFIYDPQEVLNELRLALSSQFAQAPTLEQEQERINKAIESKAGERGRLIALRVRGTISEDEAEASLNTLRAESSQLQREREALTEREAQAGRMESQLLTIEALLSQLAERADNADNELKREIVMLLVQRITATRDKSDLTGKLPPNINAVFSFSGQQSDVNYVEHGGLYSTQLTMEIRLM